jgi:hypothetical protein
MVGFFVAATVITLVQYVRLRHDAGRRSGLERRLLPLLALFVLLALAHSRGAGDPWGPRFHLAAGTAGLAQLILLTPRPARR